MDADSLAESLARAERIKAIKNAVRNRELIENTGISQSEGDIKPLNQVHIARKTDNERKPVSHAREVGIPDVEIPPYEESVPVAIRRPENKSFGKKKKKKKKLGRKLRGLFPEKGDSALESARKIVFMVFYSIVIFIQLTALSFVLLCLHHNFSYFHIIILHHLNYIVKPAK